MVSLSTVVDGQDLDDLNGNVTEHHVTVGLRAQIGHLRTPLEASLAWLSPSLPAHCACGALLWGV